MLKPKNLASAVAAALAIAAVPAVQADENDILLKVLVRKGILTQDEASAVKAEVAKEKAKEAKIAAKSAPVTTTSDNGALSKLDISKSIDRLKLYGDLRLRYQYDDKDPQLFIPKRPENRDPSGSQQSRWRFRLRIGAEIALTDQWSAGFELGTAQPSDSGNQTFENGFDDYDIFINRAYIRWDPNKAFTFVGGKMPNPFYTTDLVWDPDITPNGIAEVIRFHELFGGETEEEVGYSKDGKTVASKAVKSERNWELSLVAGQFLFDDNNENNFDSDESTDAYTFQTQLLGTYKFHNGVKVTAAPGWLVNSAGTVTGATNNNPFNDNPNVSGATRNINLLLFPGDVAFNMGKTKTKFYWDFSYNIEGRKRAEDIYNLVSSSNDAGQGSDDNVTDPDDFKSGHSPQDDFAYLVGMQFGENKKAGDWSFRADWRSTGISAVDPNLNDSDFAAGELNTRGIKLGLAYNFTDFAIGAVTWYQGWNIRNNLIGGEATGGNAIADSNTVRVLQVDFSIKF